jgi:hypothetical protein
MDNISLNITENTNSKKEILPRPKLIRQTNNINPFQQKSKSYVKISQVSYDDILNKMGMFVKDGKLHTIQENNKPNVEKVSNTSSNIIDNKKNSYIYNKYFKNEIHEGEPEKVIPKNINEYKVMLIKDIIEKEKIRRIKSRKLFIENSNIIPRNNVNVNKLFSFSK